MTSGPGFAYLNTPRCEADSFCMARVLVMEVNELPPRVVRWWCERHPDSALAQLVDRGTLSTTILDEELPRDLYPSQSWASVGTGVPWSEHGIFWYGDPKPVQHPFYWQRAADAGRSVGMIGVLHSSPVARVRDDAYRFVVPDFLDASAAAYPASLEPAAALNRRLSAASGRVASVSLGPRDLPAIASFARHGLTPATGARLARLTGNVAAGRWNKERLRAGQSLLMADVFCRQVQRHDPDLGVYFCNHVASALHRYWAASFPQDWPTPPYDPEWRAQFADEIPFAMRTLDLLIEQFSHLGERTGRELIIISSMGQQADLALKTEGREQTVVRDARRFLSVCGVEGAEVLGTMVPQLTVQFADAAEVALAERRLTTVLGAAATSVMVADTTLTLTYELECSAGMVRIDGRWRRPSEVGCSIEAIRDHRSGRHHPDGVLISDRPGSVPEILDAFSVAPWLLDRLGVTRATRPASAPADGRSVDWPATRPQTEERRPIGRPAATRSPAAAHG